MLGKQEINPRKRQRTLDPLTHGEVANREVESIVDSVGSILGKSMGEIFGINEQLASLSHQERMRLIAIFEETAESGASSKMI